MTEPILSDLSAATLPGQPPLNDIAGLVEKVAAGWDRENPDSPMSCVVGIEYGPSPACEFWLPDDAAASPLDALVGLVAPESWRAIGVIAQGTAWRPGSDGVVDDSVDWACPPTGEARVRVVHVSDRTSAHVTRIAQSCTGATSYDGLGELGPPESGRALDICRRVLELPTDRPRAEPGRFWDSVWLDRILTVALCADTNAVEWENLVGLHPALHATEGIPPVKTQVLSARDARRERVTESPWSVRNLGRLLAEEFGWADLLHACRRAEWHTDAVSSAEAEWMDRGIFSRALVGHYPDIELVLADLDDLLPPALLTRIGGGLCARKALV